MFGTTRSSDGLDSRRRRILYRSWHRGTREMDLFMGRFADAEVETLSNEELDDLEHIMAAEDQDLYAWLTGKDSVPKEYDIPLFHRILAYAKAHPLTA